MRPRLRRLLQPALHRIEQARSEVLEIRSGDPLASQFAAFGRGSVIQWPPTELGNTRSIAIGAETTIRTRAAFEALAPPGTVVIRIGNRNHIGHGVRFVAVNGIDVGDDCGIGHGSTLTDTIHDYKSLEEGAAPWQSGLKVGRPLQLEQGAWVGNNCVVAGGITIGARAIIGPNCFVNRNVPTDTIVAGNPARVQRRKLPSGEWEWLVDPASLELEVAEAAAERQG